MRYIFSIVVVFALLVLVGPTLIAAATPFIASSQGAIAEQPDSSVNSSYDALVVGLDADAPVAATLTQTAVAEVECVRSNGMVDHRHSTFTFTVTDTQTGNASADGTFEVSLEADSGVPVVPEGTCRPNRTAHVVDIIDMSFEVEIEASGVLLYDSYSS
jgi:hypothetical protein